MNLNATWRVHKVALFMGFNAPKRAQTEGRLAEKRLLVVTDLAQTRTHRTLRPIKQLRPRSGHTVRYRNHALHLTN